MQTARSICLIAAAAACILVLPSCDIDLTSDDEITEDTIIDFFESGAVFVQLEAVGRLLAAINGDPVEGVTLTPAGNVVNAAVEMDFDFNGSLETQVDGSVTFSGTEMSFENGATVRVNNISGADVTGNATATATSSGPASVVVGGSGTFEGESGIPVDVGLNLTVTPAANLVTGSVDIDAGDVEATAFFEDDLQGGFRIRVVGTDFDVTIEGI